MSTNTTIPAASATIPASATNQVHTSRLHTVYTNLSFKCDPSDPEDTRREALFQRLVVNHLLDHSMQTQTDWLNNAQAQQERTFDFLTKHGKVLWPGRVAKRSHLATPALAKKLARSFVADVDGHWKAAGGGKSKAQMNAEMAPGAYAVDSQVGHRAHSRVGRAFGKYVGVLLEAVPARSAFIVEDAGRLVAEIVGAEVGDEVEMADDGARDVMVGSSPLTLPSSPGSI